MNRLSKQLSIAAVLALFALGAWFAFGRERQAPDVEVTRLDGQPLRMGDLKGKVVLVNFWATTCTTCVKEMPRMVDTWRKYAPRGYEMVAVAMQYDNPDWVRDYTRRSGLPVTVAMDRDGRAAKAFGDVRLTPTSYLIDRKGRITVQYLGEPGWDALHARIERLLADPA